MSKPLYPDDPEIRITALLLGELDPTEAATVRNAIAKDPELARLHNQLRTTIALVRHTVALPTPGQASAEANPVSPRMSEERRRNLIAKLRGQSPSSPVMDVPDQPHLRIPWQLSFALAAILVALFSSLALVFPSWTRQSSQWASQYAQAALQESERFDSARGRPVAAPKIRFGFESPSGTALAGHDNDANLDLPEVHVDKSEDSPSPDAAFGLFAAAESGVGRQGGFGGGGGGMPTSAPDDAGRTWYYSESHLAEPLGTAESLGLVDESARGLARVPTLGDTPTLGTQLVESAPLDSQERIQELAESSAFSPTVRGFDTPGRAGDLAFNEPSTVASPVTAPTPTSDFTWQADRENQPMTLRLGARYGLAPAQSAPPPTQPSAPADTAAPALDHSEPLNLNAAGESLVPLDIKLPIPAFMGTPTDLPLTRTNTGMPQRRLQEDRIAGVTVASTLVVEDREPLPDPASPEIEAGRKLSRTDKGEGTSIDSLQLGQAIQLETASNPKNAPIEKRHEAQLEALQRSDSLFARPQLGTEAELELRTRDAPQPVGSARGSALLDSQDPGRAQITAGFSMVSDDGLLTPSPAVPPVPQPEVLTAEDPVSTFSLNVTDVSFKLAAASLERGQLPAANTIRSEEFINAFDYQDPEPTADRRVGLVWERARYPFGHQRDLLRLSVKTAARGREPARPLNLVLCLDSSGSMERADRVQIVHEALTVLAQQLGPADLVSVVAFARTARLWVDALPGGQAAELLQRVGELTPEGGTNLEEALRLAYATAARHHQPDSVSRVVLLTDGAANLGDVEPESLRNLVVAQRRQGIALDCFGVGWEGYHDELLETLSRNGDGRYGFLNNPEEAVTGFADQLAGALQVAASDVKVQLEFNPERVRYHRLIGYTKHQLTQEQFRDNTVDAAELGAAESGSALYVIQTDPAGKGPLAVARVRFKLPGTDRVEEREWTLPYTGPASPLEQGSPALRLAATAGAFAEWLASIPYASEVTPTALLNLLRGVPEVYALDPRPRQLEWMIRQAGSISGR